MGLFGSHVLGLSSSRLWSLGFHWIDVDPVSQTVAVMVPEVDVVPLRTVLVECITNVL